MSTTPSTPRLSEVARHLVIPDGIVTTAYHRIKPRLAAMGVGYDPWQDGAATVALGCRADGKFAATVGGVVWSIPRQVGKTYTVGNLLIALAIEVPGIRIVWTSHHGRTTTNTFRSMQGMVKRKKVRPFMPPGGGVRIANGEQEIRFANGSIIMFGAREHGFGRGMDAVDILVFDEAQILDIKALEDMVPATNQARNPHGGLVFFIGTPPRPIDNGEAFTAKRRRALSGDARDMFYVEMSADPDANLDDQKQWAKANPSFPNRTPLESMLRMRENIPDDDSWRREALGIWGELTKSYAFGAGKWESCALDHDPAPHPAALALSVSMDRKWASIGGAALVEIDEKPRLMGAAVDRREGTGWLVPEAKRLHDTYGCRIAVTRSASDLIPAFEAVGLMVGGALEVVRAGDAQDACAVIYDRVQDGTFAHANHDDLDLSVYGAHRRNVADRWVWDRKNSETDVSMLEAVTAATWLAALNQNTTVEAWEAWT
jgi:hypothetical protein